MRITKIIFAFTLVFGAALLAGCCGLCDDPCDAPKCGC